MKKAKKVRKLWWFTLVELIVVITVLAILWTIGFVSLQGYSGNARDGNRVSDMANLSKSLDIYLAKYGLLPVPDNAFSVTYLGWTLWNQWTISDGMVTSLSSVSGLSKKPSDPLTSNEYSYSLSAQTKEYQLKADYEWALSLALLSEAYADNWNPKIAYLRGNYNGMVAKTSTWGIIYLLAVPSLVSAQSASSGSSMDVATTLSWKLVISWGSNSGSMAATLAYASDALPTEDTDRSLFASGLALAYSGSSLASNANISPFINALASSDSASLALLGKNTLCTLYWACWASMALCPAYSSATTYVAWQCFSYNFANITVTATGRGTSTSTYKNCPSPDLAIWTNGAATPQVWSLCNVGANTVFTGYRAGADDSPVATESTAGKYFQWGENTAWTYAFWSNATDNCDWNRITQSCWTTNLSAWPASVSDGIYGGSNRWYDWSTTNTQGPCAKGYHVPTQSEWSSAYVTLGSSRNTFDSVLKVPMGGYRWSSAVYFQWGTGYFWSSTPFQSSAYNMVHNSGLVNPSWNMARDLGFLVRCIRN